MNLPVAGSVPCICRARAHRGHRARATRHPSSASRPGPAAPGGRYGARPTHPAAPRRRTSPRVTIPFVDHQVPIPAALTDLASWSPWHPLAPATMPDVPRLPGVYLAGRGTVVVYVGYAGYRKGRGLYGRLNLYATGRARTAGSGTSPSNAPSPTPCGSAPGWPTSRPEPRRPCSNWTRLAVHQAGLRICWTTTADGAAAKKLERNTLNALHDHALWNRSR